MKQNKRNRPLLTITIDKKILNDFHILVDKKSINKSKLIENLIKEWMHENKEKPNPVE